MEVEYEKIGLKVGLEIHQQLDTAAKLFCECKPGLFKEEPEITFLRRLRPTQSELGQIDPAAYFEFQKGLKILYEANTTTSCLVEMDEEPPHPLNTQAAETTLMAALMMKARLVDEIHVLRKTVIDGSNTTGFQRTCVIALDGEVKVGEKIVPIQHVSLEEDAARKTGEDQDNTIRYRIDRLGIPLIEVATAPVIKSPKEAQEVAFAIGRILRATGRVMRGLGTIRQDLNISIPNGALVEIKGVQELALITQVVQNEIQRQVKLIEIRKELCEAGVTEDSIKGEFSDASDVFRKTKCSVIRKALDHNKQVLAVKLSGFAGFLKRELLPDFRLGTEMADRARFWGRVGGIFHTDEMPAYGITAEEVKALRETVKAETDDAVVFVADNPENAKDALKAVVDRAREATMRVPEETRAANPAGTTRYMRPRPGAARMYPETDIPPTQLSEEYVASVRKRLPELPEQRMERLMRDRRLNDKLAKQVLDSEYGELFETAVKDSGVSPTTVAVFLTETLKASKREGIDVDNVSDEQVLEMFRAVGTGELMKEALQDVFVWLSKNQNRSVEDALASLGLTAISEKELGRLVEETLAENAKLVKERGEDSFGALMGIVMKRLRGRVDASQVSKVLREKLKEKLR